MIAPWLAPQPRKKTYIFKDDEGHELKLVAEGNGDEVEVYLWDEPVTYQVKKLLGPEWFREVSRDVAPIPARGVG